VTEDGTMTKQSRLWAADAAVTAAGDEDITAKSRWTRSTRFNLLMLHKHSRWAVLDNFITLLISVIRASQLSISKYLVLAVMRLFQLFVVMLVY